MSHGKTNFQNTNNMPNHTYTCVMWRYFLIIKIQKVMETTEINKKNIPKEYIIELQGKMNKGVFDCIESGWTGKCKNNVSHRQSKYNVVEDIIGFAPSKWGTMVVWKCRTCGQIQFFHLRENEAIQHHDYVRMYHQFKTTGAWD